MLKPSAWPAGIYLRAAWLGQVVTVSWILDTSLTKTKTDPQTRTQLVDFFSETFCCVVRCAFCLTLKHASRGTWLVSDAGTIVEIEQSIMSQSVLNIVDQLVKFRQSKYGSSLRCCNMLLVYHFYFRFFSTPWLLCVQPICSTLRQHAWMELDSKERATLVDHFLADGIQHLAIIFTFLPVPRDFLSRVIWTRGHSGKWLWLTLLDRKNVKIVKGSPFPSCSIFLYEMGGVGWVGPSHWCKTHVHGSWAQEATQSHFLNSFG